MIVVVTSIIVLLIVVLYIYKNIINNKINASIIIDSSNIEINKYNTVKLTNLNCAGISRVLTYDNKSFSYNIPFNNQLSLRNNYMYAICVGTDKHDCNINYIAIKFKKIKNFKINKNNINFEFINDKKFKTIINTNKKFDINAKMCIQFGQQNAQCIKHTPCYILGKSKDTIKGVTMSELSFIPSKLIKMISPNISANNYILLFIQHNNITRVIKTCRRRHRRLNNTVRKFEKQFDKIDYDKLTEKEKENIAILYVYDLDEHRNKLIKNGGEILNSIIEQI